MSGPTNPMHNHGVRVKVSTALKGRPFPTKRGGNGAALTAPQQALLAMLPGWVAEYSVPGAGVSTWRCVTVDLALPEKKWAVEVDGPSHNTLKQQSRDMKKASLLNKCGWTLLRIKNPDVSKWTSEKLQKYFESH